MEASEVILKEMEGGYHTIPTWTLADTLSWITIIVAIYLISVKKALPEIMQNRPPYKLTKILLWYNAFQVIFSAYIVLIYASYIWKHGIITTRCPQGNDLQEVINGVYPYFIAKHLDLLDTVFFVLRKKDNQITFLHIYHHTAMVSWTWLHLMHHPTDHFVVVGLLNSFVHVLMYAYYGISSLGPEYVKYVWWKKHLTKVQLVQFVLVVSDLYYQQKLSPCPIPYYFHWYSIFVIISFFILFMNFYFRSYTKKTKRDLEAPSRIDKSCLNVKFTETKDK